ncbi:MAG: hypothetical protein JSU73_00655 [candidate division WOR-3 bacterium]|nr:MAG: hypothetical protein JSU73_00655 [candidate division WOR-3 bacterium]
MSTKSSTTALVSAALAALAVFCGCGDVTPPEVDITSPADSVVVSGVVSIEASAYDSAGVVNVQFYADGSLVGEDALADYSADWNTDELADESWHFLNCVAWDLAGNSGYSDTVHVQVRRGGQHDVLHGAFILAGGHRRQAWFLADEGDSLSGEVRVANSRNLPLFLCVDAANFQLYTQGGQFQALHRAENVPELTMAVRIPGSDTFYLVFSNTGPDSLGVWARFTLE